MKTNNFLLNLIIFILVAGLSGVGVFLWQKNKIDSLQNENTKIKEYSVEVQDKFYASSLMSQLYKNENQVLRNKLVETEKDQVEEIIPENLYDVYDNEILKFNYPRDWHVYSFYSPDRDSYINLDSKPIVYKDGTQNFFPVKIIIEKNDGKSLEEVLSQREFPEIVDSENLKVSNYDATKLAYYSMGGAYIEYYIVNDANIFRVIYYPALFDPNLSSLANYQLADELEQIIDSLSIK